MLAIDEGCLAIDERRMLAIDERRVLAIDERRARGRRREPIRMSIQVEEFGVVLVGGGVFPRRLRNRRPRLAPNSRARVDAHRGETRTALAASAASASAADSTRATSSAPRARTRASPPSPPPPRLASARTTSTSSGVHSPVAPASSAASTPRLSDPERSAAARRLAGCAPCAGHKSADRRRSARRREAAAVWWSRRRIAAPRGARRDEADARARPRPPRVASPAVFKTFRPSSPSAAATGEAAVATAASPPAPSAAGAERPTARLRRHRAGRGSLSDAGRCRDDVLHEAGERRHARRRDPAPPPRAAPCRRRRCSARGADGRASRASRGVPDRRRRRGGSATSPSVIGAESRDERKREQSRATRRRRGPPTRRRQDVERRRVLRRAAPQRRRRRPPPRARPRPPRAIPWEEAREAARGCRAAERPGGFGGGRRANLRRRAAIASGATLGRFRRGIAHLHADHATCPRRARARRLIAPQGRAPRPRFLPRARLDERARRDANGRVPSPVPRPAAVSGRGPWRLGGRVARRVLASQGVARGAGGRPGPRRPNRARGASEASFSGVTRRSGVSSHSFGRTNRPIRRQHSKTSRETTSSRLAATNAERWATACAAWRSPRRQHHVGAEQRRRLGAQFELPAGHLRDSRVPRTRSCGCASTDGLPGGVGAPGRGGGTAARPPLPLHVLTEVLRHVRHRGLELLLVFPLVLFPRRSIGRCRLSRSQSVRRRSRRSSVSDAARDPCAPPASSSSPRASR